MKTSWRFSDAIFHRAKARAAEGDDETGIGNRLHRRLKPFARGEISRTFDLALESPISAGSDLCQSGAQLRKALERNH